jgi:hypothetical protein
MLLDHFDKIGSSRTFLVVPPKRVTYALHCAFEGGACIHYCVLVVAFTIMLMCRQKLILCPRKLLGAEEGECLFSNLA